MARRRAHKTVLKRQCSKMRGEKESSTPSSDLTSVSRMNPKWRVVGRGGEGEGERKVGRPHRKQPLSLSLSPM